MHTSRLLSISLGLLFATPAAAQTITHYWVDATTGADTNPGTRAKPFKSVTKGVATGQRDAVIHVLPGTYSPTKTGETFTIVLSAVYQNVKLLGADAATCILDFEKVNASRSSWYFLIETGAQNIEIAHLTMKNGAFRPAVPWFSSAIWWQSVKGLDLHHCVIESCESGIYSAAAPQDVHVHDNVFLGCNVAVRFRQDQAAGAKDCRFYNNLVASSTGAFPDTVSPSGKDPTQVFVNNLVINNGGAGFQGTLLQGVVFENNNSFNNTGGNYNMGTAQIPASNISKDPLLVDFAKRDFRLKAGSPCIEAGFATPQPKMTSDFYGNARVSDHDRNLQPVPDIGLHEAPGVTLGVANWGQGMTARFTATRVTTGNVGGLLLFGFRETWFVLPPYGSIGLNPLGILATTPIGFGSALSVPLPKDPALDGLTLYWQVLGFGPTSRGIAWNPSGRLDLEL